MLEYDFRGNLKQVTSPDPNSSDEFAAPVTRFEYDKLNRRTAEIDALNHRTEFHYNALGRLESVTRAVGTTSAPHLPILKYKLRVARGL